MDLEDCGERLKGRAAWQPDGYRPDWDRLLPFHSSNFSLHPLYMFGNTEPNPQLQPGHTQSGKAKQRTARIFPITDNSLISCEQSLHPQHLPGNTYMYPALLLALPITQHRAGTGGANKGK